MASNWPLEARLHFINELYLVIGQSTRVDNHITIQADCFWLIKAIVNDTTHRINNKCGLVQVLKKSPVWEKVKVFMENSDMRCKRKGCNGHLSDHNGPNGVCLSSHYVRYSLPRMKCTCPGFVPKTL